MSMRWLSNRHRKSHGEGKKPGNEGDKLDNHEVIL